MNKLEKHFGSWYRIMYDFLESNEFKEISKFLKNEHAEGKKIYPVFDDVFRAFKECPYDDLCSVFLTNNAYVNGEMDGLAFSSRQAVSINDTPPVLTKILDSVERDMPEGLYLHRYNDLTRWANQGILLLNCDPTTEKGKPGSHLEIWKPMIEYLMKYLAEYNTGILYFLIGKQAAKYYDYIDVLANDFLVIEHPMNAVKEHRHWKHKNLFADIKRSAKFLTGKEISWTREK